MKTLIGTIAAGMLLAGYASAQTPGKPSAADRQDLLYAAGFKISDYTTPAFAAAMKQHLPPHTFVHHTANGVMTYYYLDPTICRCLYTGTPQNWAAYKQDASSRLHMDAELSLMKEDVPFSGGG